MADYSSYFNNSAPVIPGKKSLEKSFGLAMEGAKIQTGKKPVIPTLSKIGEQEVSNFNRFNFEQLGSMVREANPYFDTQAAQLNKNITADLQGVLPQDVVDRYRNLAAAATTGSGQSQRDTTTLRDLGVLSLDRMDKGFAKSLGFGDYMKKQLVPEQQLLTPGFQAQQNESQFNRDLMAADVLAAADPQQAALGKVLETYAGLLASQELASTQGFSQIVSGGGGAKVPMANASSKLEGFKSSSSSPGGSTVSRSGEQRSM